MPFTTPLDLRAFGEDQWVLIHKLSYYLDGATYVVPKGFVTDLASIPQAVQWVFPVNDAHRMAAVLHDFLYCSQRTTRAEADGLFLQAMADLGVPLWKRWAMYGAVRSFGWAPWNAKKGCGVSPRA